MASGRQNGPMTQTHRRAADYQDARVIENDMSDAELEAVVLQVRDEVMATAKDDRTLQANWQAALAVIGGLGRVSLVKRP